MPYKDPDSRKAYHRNYMRKRRGENPLQQSYDANYAAKYNALPDVKKRKAEQHQVWREANREHLLAYKKKYHQENKAAETLYARTQKQEKKKKAVYLLGGACKNCGGVFHPSVYDFHHRNPSEKEFQPSSLMTYSWERIEKELQKCDLLCSNCHRIEHHAQENSCGV